MFVFLAFCHAATQHTTVWIHQMYLKKYNSSRTASLNKNKIRSPVVADPVQTHRNCDLCAAWNGYPKGTRIAAIMTAANMTAFGDRVQDEAKPRVLPHFCDFSSFSNLSITPRPPRRLPSCPFLCPSFLYPFPWTFPFPCLFPFPSAWGRSQHRRCRSR